MAPRPIPHSILSSSATLIRPHPIQKVHLETSVDKVAKYSKVLKQSNCRHAVSHALLRLAQLDCPMRVFETCKSEKRLQRFEGNVVWTMRSSGRRRTHPFPGNYERMSVLCAVNILKRKFEELRRKEEAEKTGKKAAKLELKEEEYEPEFSGSMGLKSTIMEKYAEYKPTPIRKFIKFNR
ncbi:hypothetical protein GCK72_004218 [Caenorhabditis remanei]|uniref:Uncharacterized protein n=1 Tax=Caenorhabditis remanei TaxID=31234 RepID=A0A6A5HBK5_CAERE|nr:hypothetical protein GCK72_004218 [Caenorhabditis remanei]KAF1764271.1 hypothetical protein GCK72_004218 [Caenorhabditis remanei]